MRNTFQLLRQSELFYINALQALAQTYTSYTMPDNDEEEDDNNKSFQHFDDFDIKDEKLFEQFDQFQKTYDKLMYSLSITPDHLSLAKLEDSDDSPFQLIDTLNKKYERIMNNSYLNMSEEEGYDEDFDPGVFTAFIQKIVNGAEEKLKQIAGEDINIDEARAAQYANEFNQQMIDRGDTTLTFTGNKIQQLMNARKNYFQKLMLAKKIGKSHPDYYQYEKYVAMRHRAYDTIKEDPARLAEYRKKSKERQIKFQNKLIIKKKELEESIKSIQSANDLSKIEKESRIERLTKELAEVDSFFERKRIKNKEIATKIRETKNSGELIGLVIHLQQKLASKKSDVAKAVKNKAKKDPYFNPFKDAVKDAKEKYEQDKSPNNEQILNSVIRAEVEAIKNYLDRHAAVIRVKDDMAVIYPFRDQAKVIADDKSAEISPEMQQHIYQTIISGEKLISNFSGTYKEISDAIRNIVQQLKSKL